MSASNSGPKRRTEYRQQRTTKEKAGWRVVALRVHLFDQVDALARKSVWKTSPFLNRLVRLALASRDLVRKASRAE